ncbi:hypothetical protein [Pedobacter arcticus]
MAHHALPELIKSKGNTVAFLLSNKSNTTLGQILYVDGGYAHLDRVLADA